MILENLLSCIVLLLAFSGIGLLFFPSAMLSIVGIEGNEQLNFLLRTSGVGVVSLIPSAWASRNEPESAIKRAVIVGLATYMFLSSFVDLVAYKQALVNTASIPSIIFRVLIGIVLLWLMRRTAVK
jgi:hypothetical protein